ncbi:hypothetical protein [Streptomyces sp. NPDC048659]|uniref:hypothetical protein n=1 Tax=Streptomyces sp. NPDC048659 TaxID=3155489 RepID=UPI003437EEB2
MNHADTTAPIYSELIREQGDVPGDVRRTAEEVLRDLSRVIQMPPAGMPQMPQAGMQQAGIPQAGAPQAGVPQAGMAPVGMAPVPQGGPQPMQQAPQLPQRPQLPQGGQQPMQHPAH